MPRNTLILGLAIAVVQTLPAQAPPAEAEEPLKLSVTAELVLLDVSVKDKAGEHVSNLSRQNFSIYEDNALQKIVHFASEDVPVTVGLVIDTSGSMRPKYDNVVTAALVFIQGSNPNDEVFVVNFGDRVSSGLPGDVPFTADLNRLRSALLMGTPAGRTALYDAVLYSLAHLAKGKWARKTLLLISDGGDNNSVHGAEEMTRMVRESLATIYSIGIYDLDDPDHNPALLRRLTAISGGESYFPDGLPAIGGICRQIASDIRVRYTIGYVPARSGEQGAVRKIKVTASTAEGKRLIVHTRSSYVLPDRRPAVDRQGGASRKRGL